MMIVSCRSFSILFFAFSSSLAMFGIALICENKLFLSKKKLFFQFFFVSNSNNLHKSCVAEDDHAHWYEESKNKESRVVACDIEASFRPFDTALSQTALKNDEKTLQIQNFLLKIYFDQIFTLQGIVRPAGQR